MSRGFRIQTILGAFFYAPLFYVKDWVSVGGEIDWPKLGTTLIVGVGVGVVFAFAGNPLGQQQAWEQLATYAGLVAFIDQLILKIIPTAIKNKNDTGSFKGDSLKSGPPCRLGP